MLMLMTSNLNLPETRVHASPVESSRLRYAVWECREVWTLIRLDWASRICYPCRGRSYLSKYSLNPTWDPRSPGRVFVVEALDSGRPRESRVRTATWQ